jgi:hypothetical protein
VSSYGDEKSASEMVFSYGFVDEDRDTALWLALDLQAPPDDPLGLAKRAVLGSAPRLQIYDLGQTVEWTSHFTWLVPPPPRRRREFSDHNVGIG